VNHSAHPFALDGKVALITGATKGIGLAASRALASAGAKIAVCARTAEDCKQVAAELEASGTEALALPGNVGHEDEIPGLVAAVVDRFGSLDILVNNAGAVAEYAAVTDGSRQAFDKAFSVNVRAPLAFAREAVAVSMGKRGGSIVNIVSISAFKTEPFLGTYAAAKAAMVSATKTMAKELGPRGIRVNAIAPGVIRTDFSRLIVETPEIHERVVAATALGRIGEPEEISGAIVWLASDAASFTTGAVIIDGGGTL
jgi:NAD(P)-dependent dehydrogenase (short-subunit alcohol dehydrogenase family)